MCPFNFSKAKTVAILASSKLTSFVSFTCFELLGVDVQLSGLSIFVCCSVSLHYLAFVSLLLLSMMLCRQLSPRPFFCFAVFWILKINIIICVNHDQILFLAPHKYLLKLSSCPFTVFFVFATRTRTVTPT